MSLQIVKQGMLDSIQDGGRYGHQHLGVNPRGAMDLIAMKIANALVGNMPDEPVLEMHYPPAIIRFDEDALIAMGGADFGATIDEEEVNILQPLVVDRNSILRFTKKKTGARCYLAVQGGLGNKKFPYHFSGAGNVVALPWRADVSGLYVKEVIRFIPGHEFSLLTETSQHALTTRTFTIGSQSDRMGYRLSGEPLLLKETKELVSTAVTKGTIQLLPSGQLIILMADHQTTGGYPRVGYVISADIPSLAQMNAGQYFSFAPVTIAEAESFLQQQEMHLQQLQYSCNFRIQEYFSPI